MNDDLLSLGVIKAWIKLGISWLDFALKNQLHFTGITDIHTDIPSAQVVAVPPRIAPCASRVEGDISHIPAATPVYRCL